MPQLTNARRALDAALPPRSSPLPSRKAKPFSHSSAAKAAKNANSGGVRKGRRCYILAIALGALMCIVILANVVYVGRMAMGASSILPAAPEQPAAPSKDSGRADAAPRVGGKKGRPVIASDDKDDFKQKLEALKAAKNAAAARGRTGTKDLSSDELEARRAALMKRAQEHRAKGGDVADPKLLEALINDKVLAGAAHSKGTRKGRGAAEMEEKLIEEMLKVHGDPKQKAAVMKRLAALRAGIAPAEALDGKPPASKPRSQWSKEEASEVFHHDQERFGVERAVHMDRERQRLEKAGAADALRPHAQPKPKPTRPREPESADAGGLPDGGSDAPTQRRHVDATRISQAPSKDDPYFAELLPQLQVPPVSGGFIPTARPMDEASIAKRAEARKLEQQKRVGGRREPEIVHEGYAPLDASTVKGVLSFVGVQVCTQRVTRKGAALETVSLHTCDGDDRDDVWEHTQNGQLRFTQEDKCLMVGPSQVPSLHFRKCSSVEPSWGAQSMNWRRIVEPTKFRQSAQLQSVEHPDLCLSRIGTKNLGLTKCVEMPSQLSEEYQKTRSYWGYNQDQYQMQRVNFFADGAAAGRDGGQQKTYDFNEVMSVDVGYRRNHEHLRSATCDAHDYGDESILPTSVIICFVNEEWYALLRTVHAVIDASPPHLLQEIVLVDDGSDAWWLGEELEHYVATELPAGLVRIVRTGERLGLIRARLLGARASSAPILTFLDSHVEVNYGWLPPLLRPITDDRTRVTCPVITVINQKTVQQQTSFDSNSIPFGSFDWKLTFKWLYSRNNLQPLTKPQWNGDAVTNVFSSTMAGGLFSIHREYFWELGSYDNDMRGWGGENLEMSFRIWMCGGSIEIVPCSLVGHIFRQHNPSPFDENIVSILRHNLQRAAASLMDDFQYTYYRWAHSDISSDEDVTLRLKLREYHQCHDFAWYVENVAPGMVAPSHDTLSFIGSLMSLSGERNTCVQLVSSSARAGSAVSLGTCWTHANTKSVRRSVGDRDKQRFIATHDGRISGSAFPSTTVCLDLGHDTHSKTVSNSEYKPVVMSVSKCQPKQHVAQRFHWVAAPNLSPDDFSLSATDANGRGQNELTVGVIQVKHSDDDDSGLPLSANAGTCLGYDTRNRVFVTAPCNTGDSNLLWALLQSAQDTSEMGIMTREEYDAYQATRAGTSRKHNALPKPHPVKQKALPVGEGSAEAEGKLSQLKNLAKDSAKNPFKSRLNKLRESHGNAAGVARGSGAGTPVVQTPPYKGSRFHGVVGLDESGKPLWVPTPVPGKAEQNKAIHHHGFNASLSESLPLDRDILDKRAQQCKTSITNYPSSLDGLPDTTVIFVFVNEEKSVLLRSIHSVLNRSPPQLLKEIILVDDGSDEEYITAGVHEPGSLEEYIAFALPDKVRLIRQGARTGLIAARLAGMRAATSQTVTVLDSHIEVQNGWLEPLMNRIAGDRRRVVMPVIDGLSANNMQPSAGGIQVLGILWGMTEHGIPLQQIHRSQPGFDARTDPQASPFMAGGLFSVDRKFMLDDLEGYDTEIKYWGAENLEFSLRTWMCGGSIEMMPCSRVYHIFRTLGGKPYTVPGNAVTHNKLRVVKGWLDAPNQPWALNQVVGDDRGHAEDSAGDFTAVRKVQEKLQCHDFSWFLENVYPENAVSECRNSQYFGQLFLADAGKCLMVNRYGGIAASFVDCETPLPQGTQVCWIAELARRSCGLEMYLRLVWLELLLVALTCVVLCCVVCAGCVLGVCIVFIAASSMMCRFERRHLHSRSGCSCLRSAICAWPRRSRSVCTSIGINLPFRCVIRCRPVVGVALRP